MNLIFSVIFHDVFKNNNSEHDLQESFTNTAPAATYCHNNQIDMIVEH